MYKVTTINKNKKNTLIKICNDVMLWTYSLRFKIIFNLFIHHLFSSKKV